MIVCVCVNVSDTKIKAALEECNTLEHVQQKTGACTCCQTCEEHILEMIEEQKKILVP